MNDKEKIILGKLLKIAANQQKILTRLAQQDPNISYLKQAAMVTAANSGFNATHVEVTANPGTTIEDPVPNPASTTVEGGYTVKIAGAPKQNELREKFIRQLKTMVSTQKPDQPELSNLSVIFTD